MAKRGKRHSTHDAERGGIEDLQVGEVRPVDARVTGEESVGVRDRVCTDQEVGQEMLADLNWLLALWAHGLERCTAMPTEEPVASSSAIRLKCRSGTAQACRIRSVATDTSLLQERIQPVTLEVWGQFRIHHVEDHKSAGSVTGLQRSLGRSAKGRIWGENVQEDIRIDRGDRHRSMHLTATIADQTHRILATQVG